MICTTSRSWRFPSASAARWGKTRMRREITLLALLTALLMNGCMGYVAAYHTSSPSPSKRYLIAVSGLSGLGKPYSGVNDKNADLHMYELRPDFHKPSKAEDYRLLWHTMLPVRSIGDMSVEFAWESDDLVHLRFYDFGPVDASDAQKLGTERHFVSEMSIHRNAEGKWQQEAR